MNSFTRTLLHAKIQVGRILKEPEKLADQDQLNYKKDRLTRGKSRTPELAREHRHEYPVTQKCMPF